MKTLCLHPLRSNTKSQNGSSLAFVSISSDDCVESPLILWVDRHARLRVSPAAKLRRKDRGIARLLYRESNANSKWLFAPSSDGIVHNGIRPLPLAIVEPGDVLAFGKLSWLTSELWRPVPALAPEAVAEKECSVCGAALKLAAVIQCPCGRYYHLERPEQPDDPEALNCYLTAGMCGLCQRKPSLDPQFLPVPPEELISPDDLETALASV